MPADLIEDLSATAERVRRATVQVEGGGRRGGSGVIWRTDGLVVTNAHVARGTGGRIRLWDGRLVRVTVAARDSQLDLALLQADSGDLPAAVIGDSDALRAGQIVLAVGSPYGHAGAVTVGVIHANGGGRWVQADLRLAPGNSGGPLVDGEGRIVGINTSGLSRVMAVAIPVATVNRAVKDLLEKGRIARGYLGLGMHPVRLPDGRAGVIVIHVQPDGPAGKAGVLIGDVLLKLNGTPLTDNDDVHAQLGPDSVGKRLQAAIVRGGADTQLEIAVGERTKGED